LVCRDFVFWYRHLYYAAVSLSVGDELRLRIDKPAAGGWMIARENGQVLLVSGAIPGETVVARVERSGKGAVFARVVTVVDASADRRDPFADPLCGGCLYAHVAYPRQLEIKGQVIADALSRIGRVPMAAPVAVAASPPEGYRMRARLHVRGRRIGFFREGTHEICEPRATRQLLPETCDVLDRVAATLPAAGGLDVREIEVSENITADQRALNLSAASPAASGPIGPIADVQGVSGVTLGTRLLAGDPHVVDTLAVDGHQLALRRHVQSFFQGNRFLLGSLVARVVQHVPPQAEVVDWYAGVGLFSVAAAAARNARVQAVEDDGAAARDLVFNASGYGGAVEAIAKPVESFVRASGRRVDVLIVDPPRTGLSREALDRARALDAETIVYVSCDVATLARDVRRFIDAGYTLAAVDAFDLFPNTPHVETVVRLERNHPYP
jgi:tRNA/tmRNA/rRNA uracil-C5-methylase (TrmA/RlmC/RlmD family)